MLPQRAALRALYRHGISQSLRFLEMILTIPAIAGSISYGSDTPAWRQPGL